MVEKFKKNKWDKIYFLEKYKKQIAERAKTAKPNPNSIGKEIDNKVTSKNDPRFIKNFDETWDVFNLFRGDANPEFTFEMLVKVFRNRQGPDGKIIEQKTLKKKVDIMIEYIENIDDFTDAEILYLVLLAYFHFPVEYKEENKQDKTKNWLGF